MKLIDITEKISFSLQDKMENETHKNLYRQLIRDLDKKIHNRFNFQNQPDRLNFQNQFADIIENEVKKLFRRT